MRNLKIFAVVMFLATAVAPSWVWAEAKYSLKEITPEVNAALEARRGRYDDLAALKAKGMVGENNRGYLQALVSDPEVESLVGAENKDRQVVYKTIADQNGLAGELGTIEEVFAQVQRDKAKPGEEIQDTNGQWMTK